MCRLLLMTIACLLVLFGISGLLMMPRLVQQKIEQRLQLKIGTKTFDRFTKVPIPLTVKFYLFNITNGDRVLEGLERPQFQEVGPFMFKQWRRREIVDFEDYNRRLRYREIKTFVPMFNASLHRHQQATPNLPLDPGAHNITMVNLPLLSVLTLLAKMDEGSLKRQMASLALARLIRDGGDKILVTRSAGQLLFEGYKVSFMDAARDLVSNVLGYNFESPLPRNMFGFRGLCVEHVQCAESCPRDTLALCQRASEQHFVRRPQHRAASRDSCFGRRRDTQRQKERHAQAAGAHCCWLHHEEEKH